MITPAKFYHNVGSNITLTCSFPLSSYVDIDVILIIRWNNSVSQMINLLSHSDQEFYEHSITKSSLKLTDAGEYSCTYYFISVTNNEFVIDSEKKTVNTNVTIKSEFSITNLKIHHFTFST